ncbi:unnamed protein product [Closterium sp. NIES-54]
MGPSYGFFKFTPDRISVNPLLVGRPDILTWKEAIEPQLEMAGLIGFARGTVATPSELYPDLRAEFRVVQLLTFTVILRRYSLGMQIALKPCRDLPLEEQMAHLRMGDQETAIEYCNWARRLLTTMRMSGVQYSTASYVTHVLKGLPSSYNLMKRLSVVPSTRATLNEDSLTSYILRDEAMQEAEQSLEPLPQANYVVPAKQGGQPGQRRQSIGSRSGGGRPAKDADKKKSAKESIRVVLAGRHRGADRLIGARGWRGLPGDGGGRAGKPGGGLARQWLLASPDGDEVGLRLPAAKWRRQAHARLQRCTAGCPRPRHRCLAREAGKQVLIRDVLYLLGVRANLLSAGQLKENGVKLKEDGDAMLLITAGGDILGRASYTGRVLCTDLRPCSVKSTTPTIVVVTLEATVTVTKSTPDRVHARLAHAGMDTIWRSLKHEVATRLDLKSATGADSPCVSCVDGKLARHTFPDKGSDASDVLAVMHIDLCGPFCVAAKDGSRYFLLLKDRKTRYVWVRPVSKMSGALQEFVQWLAVAERQTKKSVLMLRSDQGGEFLGREFTTFVDGKGIVHDLTCPYSSQQNGMGEREMRTVVESVQMMLLHMGVQHHKWHLALRQAECSTLPFTPLLHTLTHSSLSPVPLSGLTTPLPHSSLLPSSSHSPPPLFLSHGAPSSSGDIFDLDPLSSPVSPTHSSPSAHPPTPSSPSPPICPPSPLGTVHTQYPHTRSRNCIPSALPPVTLSTSTLPSPSPLLLGCFASSSSCNSPLSHLPFTSSSSTSSSTISGTSNGASSSVTSSVCNNTSSSTSSGNSSGTISVTSSPSRIPHLPLCGIP